MIRSFSAAPSRPLLAPLGPPWPGSGAILSDTTALNPIALCIIRMEVLYSWRVRIEWISCLTVWIWTQSAPLRRSTGTEKTLKKIAFAKRQRKGFWRPEQHVNGSYAFGCFWAWRGERKLRWWFGGLQYGIPHKELTQNCPPSQSFVRNQLKEYWT